MPELVTLDAHRVHEHTVGAAQIFDHYSIARDGESRMLAAHEVSHDLYIALRAAPDRHRFLVDRIALRLIAREAAERRRAFGSSGRFRALEPLGHLAVEPLQR